jgi:hypothetical protein
MRKLKDMLTAMRHALATDLRTPLVRADWHVQGLNRR